MADHDAMSANSDSEVSRARFASVLDTFAQAWRSAPRWEASYIFAGAHVRLRVAGAKLAHCLDLPLAHLRVRDEPGVPVLTIDLWDVDETGVAGPADEAAHAVGRRWVLEDGLIAASPDGHMVSHAARQSIIWLDRRTCRIAGWAADARALSLYDRARPLRILLALWASDRGVHAVHGAFVARDNRGVLLAGDSGSGKSTAAVSCLDAGFTYLGDDWIGIGRAHDGAPVAHSLYGSASLEPAQISRFPHLRNLAIAPKDEGDLKSIILLSEAFPTRLGRSATVCAIALPRVCDAADSRLRAATKKDALLTMTRSSIFTMRPRGGRGAMAALTRLAQELPAYWLEVGHDLEQIPRRVDEILSAAAP
jgi:hypothetical protein